MFEQMPIEFRLKHAVTAYDRKQAERASRSRRGYHNPYALPQYFQAIDSIMEAIRGSAPVRAILCQSFSGRLLDAMLVAIGEPKATISEHRR